MTEPRGHAAVVAVGGGHGLAVTLRACAPWAGSLTAVVSVADDGGSSGRLRAATGLPAPGDLRRCLTALADPSQATLAGALERRFAGGDVDGHAAGNLLLAALTAELGDDLGAAVAHVAALLGVPAHVTVVPASSTAVDLVADTHDGVTVRGQVAVESTAGVERVRLEPDAAATPAALEALAAADLVVLGPGSLYGSVLAAAVVPELTKALDVTSARRVLVCNLRPRPPETAGYDVAAHVEALRRHGVEPHVVVVQPGALAAGRLDGVEVVEVDVAGSSGAHDPERLGAVLRDLGGVNGLDRWLAKPDIFRAIVLISVVLRIAFVVAPFDVLAPIDSWELGRALWRGEVPYRDFPLEYPPGALVAFLLPGAVPHGIAPQVLALQAFAIEGTMWLLLRHDQPALRRYLLVSLFTAPLLSGGFDALPVAAVAWSTALLARSDARGWAAATFGAATKLFPGVAWGWCRRRPVAGAVALVVAVGTLLAPLAIGEREDTPIGYHVDRGVQNESVPASATFVFNRVRGEANVYEYSTESKSNELVGADGAGVASLVGFGIAAVVVAVVCMRRQRDDEAHLRALTLLLLVLCASKVLSPQFVVLLTPLAAVVGGGLFVAYLPAAVLTLGAFLVDERRSDAFVAVASVRNALLVGMAVAGLLAVVRGTRIGSNA